MRRNKIHPYIFIILTFLGVIIAGTILLALPIASTNNKSFGFSDSLFMATSAVCVTGLSVMPNGLAGDMTLFGKIVMLLLMEIGGLSIITIAVFFFTIIGAKIGISNRFLLRESLNQNNVKEITQLIKNIVLISFTIQVIGTLVNWYPFYEFLCNQSGSSKDNLVNALFISIFHAAASFNNAGFDIIGPESLVLFSSSSTLISQASYIIVNLSTMIMIISGGIGVVVFQDVLRKKRWSKFNLHTKITLIITLFLIVFGGLAIKFTSNMDWMQSFFTAITCRTAGFTTYNMANLTNYPAAYVICNILMFIGASPCSCGGGVKTTTLAVILIAIYHFSIGKKSKAFERRLQPEQISKAFILINVGIIVCLIGTFAVVAIQPNLGFEKVLFEVISAFTTTGLSMGITTSLNAATKAILCALMLFGRLGPLTVIGVLNRNWMSSSNEQIEYIEESVIIG